MTINLAELCPEATDAERTRFLTARKGDHEAALEQLESYIQWRKDLGICKNDSDLPESKESSDESDISGSSSLDSDIWDEAAAAALLYCADGNEEVQSKKLPRMVRFDANDGSENMLDKDGHRIVQILPAQMDVKIASEEVYALCIALYLDKKLSRDSMEKVCMFVDVRGGKGWANPPPTNFIQFIKKVNAILERNGPERLERCVLSPLPLYAIYLWKMVRVFLDPDTAKKFLVFNGPGDAKAKIPKKVEKYIEKNNLKRLEDNRVDSFRE